jgi:leucyl/phenylalanyl-tRNA--protein transferase
MFSHVTDASKVALVHLVARLKAGGFRLLDAQFLTAHLASLGAVEIPRARYLAKLNQAITTKAFWPTSSPIGEPLGPWPGAFVMKIIQQA